MACELCGGVKHVRQADDTWVDCECLKQERIATAFANSSLPLVYKDATWQHFKPQNKEAQAVKAVAEAVCNSYKGGSTLTGGNLYFWDPGQLDGLFLAAMIAKGAMLGGKKVLFLNPTLMFEQSMQWETAAQVIHYTGFDLIVLELANDFMNKKIPPLLCGLISQRFYANLPIIYSSMYDRVVMGNYYTEPVANLLRSTNIRQFQLHSAPKRPTLE